MTSISIQLVLVLIASSILPFSESSEERNCGSTISKLWLDVVVLVDNSAGMTDDGISQVMAQLINTFGQGTVIGDQNKKDPRNTRVALLTYNTNATVIADLNQYQSFNDLLRAAIYDLKVSTDTGSYIDQGIIVAETVFRNGRSNNYRSNYQQVLILFASAYRFDETHNPLNLATRLKQDGVAIITVGYNQTGSNVVMDNIAKLASPGFSYVGSDYNVDSEIRQAMMQVNCFCPSQWIHYRDSFNDYQSQKRGLCIHLMDMQASWKPAQVACHNMQNGAAYLVNEDSQKKHDFVFEALQNVTGFSPPYSYFIGLSLTNGQWGWEQPAGQPPIPVTSSFWNPGFPNTKVATDTVVMNQQVGDELKVGWQNISPVTAKNYVCEMLSCDTDNYCA